MFLARALTGTLLVVAASGCGSGTAGSSSDGATTRKPDRDVARESLVQAIEALQVADTGHYEHNIDLDEQRSIFAISGDYALSRSAAEAVITARVPEGQPITLVNRIVGNSIYLNVPGWPAATRDCWVIFDPDDLAQARGTPPVDGAQGYPAALSVLDGARGRKFVGAGEAKVNGTIDLAVALSLVAPKASVQHVDTLTGKRAAVTFSLSDGTLTGLTIAGADVVTAIQATEVDLPEGLERVSARVEYSRAGDVEPVTAPPSRLQRTTEQFDAGEGCER